MDDHHVVWLGALSLALAAPCLGAAQNCKPNVSGKDRVTKAQSDVWAQDVSSTGFMSQVVLEKANVNLNVAIARIGEFTIVQLTLTKEEDQNKVARAVLESQYRAEEGNQIVLGFKEGGTPLTFVASRATSETAVKGLLTPKLVTTVVLVAQIKDDELSALRDAIGARQFDVIRVSLSSQTIDKEMKGNGKKLSEKFACFFAFAEQRGFMKSVVASALMVTTTGSEAPKVESGTLSAQSPQGQLGRSASASHDNVPPTDYAVSPLLGKWVRKGKNSDYIDFSADGMFSVHQDGKSFGGNYLLQGETITLTYPAFKNQKETARFSGDTIKDQEGIVWERQAEHKSSGAPVTINQVIQMVTAKLADDIIITTIRNSTSKFDLTPDALIKLKTAGVSDAVIRAMTR